MKATYALYMCSTTSLYKYFHLTSEAQMCMILINITKCYNITHNLYSWIRRLYFRAHFAIRILVFEGDVYLTIEHNLRN